MNIELRVVIPEPCWWESNKPFLYEGPLELWQDGQFCERVQISLVAYPGEAFKGHVSRIADTVRALRRSRRPPAPTGLGLAAMWGS